MFDWGGRWFAGDGAIVVDGEPHVVWRCLRPVLRNVGLRIDGAASNRLYWITTSGLFPVMSDGTRETWTRAPAE
jgi:hypothetical protein